MDPITDARTALDWSLITVSLIGFAGVFITAWFAYRASHNTKTNGSHMNLGRLVEHNSDTLREIKGRLSLLDQGQGHIDNRLHRMDEAVHQVSDSQKVLSKMVISHLADDQSHNPLTEEEGESDGTEGSQ